MRKRRILACLFTLLILMSSLSLLSACGWGPEGVTVSARLRFYTGTEQGVVSIYNQRLNQVQRIDAPPEVQKEGYTLVGWFQASTLRGVHDAREGVHALTTGSEAEFPFVLQGRNLAYGFFASWKPNGSVITEEGFVLKPDTSQKYAKDEKYWVFIGLHPAVQPAAELPWNADTFFEFPASYGGLYIRAIKRHSVQGQHFTAGAGGAIGAGGGFTFIKVPYSVSYVDFENIFTIRQGPSNMIRFFGERKIIYLDNPKTDVTTNRPENIFTNWDEFISHPRFPKTYFVLA